MDSSNLQHATPLEESNPMHTHLLERTPFWRKIWYRYLPRYLAWILFNWAVNYYGFNVRSVISGSMACAFYTGEFVISFPGLYRDYRPAIREIQLLPIVGGEYTTLTLPKWSWLSFLTKASGKIHVGDVIVYAANSPDQERIAFQGKDETYNEIQEKKRSGEDIFGNTYIVKRVGAAPGDFIFFNKTDGSWYRKSEGEKLYKRYGNSEEGYGSYIIEVNNLETFESLKIRLPGEDRHIEQITEKITKENPHNHQFFHVGLTKKEAKQIKQHVADPNRSFKQKLYHTIYRYREPIIIETDPEKAKHPCYTLATKERPYQVPRKGMVIDFSDPIMMRYYWDFVAYHDSTHQNVVVDWNNAIEPNLVPGALFIDGKKVTKYKFRKNGVLPFGVNLAKSLDGRSNGPIPTDSINCVLNQKATFRLGRTKSRKMPLIFSALLFRMKFDKMRFLERFKITDFETLPEFGLDPFDPPLTEKDKTESSED